MLVGLFNPSVAWSSRNHLVLWGLGRPAPEADRLAGKDGATVPTPLWRMAAGAPPAAWQPVAGLGFCLTHQPRQEHGEQVREPQADSSGPLCRCGDRGQHPGSSVLPFPGTLLHSWSPAGSSGLTRTQEHTPCISVPDENFLKSAPWLGKKKPG